MAEWLMRGTVNTFFRGSIPLDAFTPSLIPFLLGAILTAFSPRLGLPRAPALPSRLRAGKGNCALPSLALARR